MTEMLHLTGEMIAVMGILLLTVYLFAFEVVRVDVAAVLIMVLIGLSGLIPGYEGLVPMERLFDGYSSNAVISIIAVMIIGAGLDRTGMMGQLAGKILRYGGSTEGRVITIVSTVVGIISSFMQNIGAAALFLPVVNRIARRGNLPISRLLMPMGFCAILGGTITMIGSSPLILLNDLINSSNQVLPAGVPQMETFDLFDVTPIGIALLACGIAYFLIAGRFVLPVIKDKPGESGSMLRYFKEVYGIEGEVYECRITRDSPLIGKLLSDVDAAGRAGWIVAVRDGNEMTVAPRGDTEFWVGSEIAIMGRREAVMRFADEYALRVKSELDVFAEVLNASSAGIAEVVIPPDSSMIGKSIKEIEIRKRYGATVLAVFRADDVIDTDLPDLGLQSGDTLVLHVSWNDLKGIFDNRNDFVVVTDFPREDERPEKTKYAVGFFLFTLGLILFTDTRLSVALMAGAVGMIISGVIKIDEAYRAIGWQSVFLLASLIPLGMAVDQSGTAAWVAQQVLLLLEGVPIWVLQSVLAVLATAFTLVMSNVGATVLLVPLAVNMAIGAGANPAVFALTVALATSNSFLIPTHQVNALIMGPGGYSVMDFMRAGGIMTIMFLVTVIIMLNLVF
ncbi:MAG: SLC13 family permease [Gammaproteobacteria bacterium]|nr:SLC13 family permease [Gammaproteobacteria bacterium]MYG65941.1 SLC13 family permease [Gammaproteobacteria bacterium]MYH90950.1 SLC13 family permease [Gammaproteobacteria bacterium]